MKNVFGAVLLLFFGVLNIAASNASDSGPLMKKLLERGVLTRDDVDELTSSEGAGDVSEERTMPEGLTLMGSMAGEYRWKKHRDPQGGEEDSSSDMYMRSVEFGLEAEMSDAAVISLVVLSEWIDDDIEQGDGLFEVDEATIAFGKDGIPLYAVIGKRALPFGVFENHLLTDPMTQDGYETKRTGVTGGFSGPADIDVSLTVYKGEEQMAHLFESGLFDESAVGRDSGEADYVGSCILSGSINPVEERFNIFAAWLSEPGRGGRNQTLNAGFNLDLPFHGALRINGEYMKALDRELYAGMSKEYKEGAISIHAAYEYPFKERSSIGSRLFRTRREHVLAEPYEISFRYEYFDDAGLADDTGSWSVKSRYSVGLRHGFYHDVTAGIMTYVAVEYRRTELRADAALGIKARNNEIYAGVGVEF